MIKNTVATLMVRLHHLPLPLPRAAPAPTYRCRRHLALEPPLPRLRASAAVMSTAAEQTIADQKRTLRAEVRKALKALSADQRASEGDASRPASSMSALVPVL